MLASQRVAVVLASQLVAVVSTSQLVDAVPAARPVAGLEEGVGGPGRRAGDRFVLQC